MVSGTKYLYRQFRTISYLTPFFLLLVAACAGVEPQPRGIEKVNHIIVIYQENWSFDSLFGKFPGANGLANAANATKQSDKSGAVYTTLPPAIGADGKPDPRIPTGLANAPFDLEPYVKSNEKAGNPTHLYWHHIHQINGGKNDRFVAWSNAGALVMSYYDGTELPLGRIAQQYTLADNFFQGAFGGSFLNHFWLVCACTPEWKNAPDAIRGQLDDKGMLVKDGQVTPDGYAVNTSFTVNTPHPKNVTDPARLMPQQTLPTIGDRLSEKGISWAWYSGGWKDALAGKAHPVFQYHHNAFAYFAKYADGTAAKAEHLRDEEQFWSDLAAGTLPAVVFIKPIGPLNEHPGYADLLSGQEHVAHMVNAIRASSSWKDTAIVITYDENGGRWDHVAPPVADRWGPGSRVPTVIVSPYAKKGFVDHTQYDTTSILKFIERRYGLAPLGTRDAAASDLTNAFEF